jgi:hypothetical protein
MNMSLNLDAGSIILVVALVGLLFNPLTYFVMRKILGTLVEEKSIPKEYILFLIHTLLFATILSVISLLSRRKEEGEEEEEEEEEDMGVFDIGGEELGGEDMGGEDMGVFDMGGEDMGGEELGGEDMGGEDTLFQ